MGSDLIGFGSGKKVRIQPDPEHCTRGSRLVSTLFYSEPEWRHGSLYIRVQMVLNSSYPLVTRATFVDRFSSNLQSRLKKVKMEFHFFLFFFKNMSILRYLAFTKKIDFVFWMPFIYISLNIYEILTANSLQPTEFKSVGIFKISLTVPEI